MAAPNIVSIATINGRTAVANVTTTATAIITNSAASNKVFKINTLIIANIDGVNVCDITVDLFRSSVAWAVANTITVPADASLVVISKENTIYLEEGDKITALASANSDLEIVVSYEELS
jgi:hypothetical protein